MNSRVSISRPFALAVLGVFRDGLRTWYEFFRIMMPIAVATKVLQDMGLIQKLGHLLSPMMKFLGLPGSMGLAWATAMVTNLYAGLLVFTALAPAEPQPLTVAQVTTLCTVMLVAHALPMELRVAQKAGLRLGSLLVVRLLGALSLGWMLSTTFHVAGWLQAPNQTMWFPQHSPNPGWVSWAIELSHNLAKIALLILLLMAILRLLEHLGVTRLLTRLLQPVLVCFGMSPAVAPLTIIGMTLGLAYGGSLIIQEARSGRLSTQDRFYSLTLMSLMHSLIEDTVLMKIVGGHLAGILWARLGFALLVVAGLRWSLRRVSEPVFTRWLMRLERPSNQATEARAVPPTPDGP